jgi:hypothetical protein
MIYANAPVAKVDEKDEKASGEDVWGVVTGMVCELV